jgi:hypothetical protein
MSGYRTWTPGEILTASNMQEYLQNQSVMVFASSAARGSAILSPAEGMLTWLEDSNKYQFYDGSSWSDLIAASSVSVKTADYTVTANDADTVLVTSSTATITITVPDVLTVGEVVQVIRNGAGSAVISAGTGVTSWAGIGTAGTALDFFIDTQYSAAAVIKTASNEYRVIGRIGV